MLLYRRHLPSKRISLPPLASPMMDGLLTPSEVAAARRKCTIVEEDEEEALEVETAAVCDDSGLKTMSRSSSTDHAATLDLASVLQNFNTKPLLPPGSEQVQTNEPTPAPFPVASQIGTGLSRQNSLRRSETSGSNSGAASPATTPPGSTPSSSQGSPARYKLGSGRKLANTRSSPQLILNQIHEEAEEGAGSSNVDPVDNFPNTSAGAVVIRRLEQRRKMRLKSRTTSCSSSDASDDENPGTENVSKRPPRPEKTPTPPPLGKEPHDDSSDSNQDPGASIVNPSGMASLNLSSRSRSRTNESSHGSHHTHKGSSNDENLEGGDVQSGHVLNSRRNRHLTRVRQSRSLNRISELHVVADFSENEDMLTRYLDSVNVNRGQTRSRDDSLTSSDGEFDGTQSQSQQSQRRTKVNLRLLEQRLNKIQEESLHPKNEDEPEEGTGGTDGDVSDNVSTVADDFSSAPAPLTTKTILIEDKENRSETTSVKSCVVTNKKPQHPRLNRAHSCGSLFSLKERALLRKKLSSHVTAAFLDILSNTNVTSEVAEVNKKQENSLALALKTNPLAVFQLQSTSRCCNLC